MSALWVPVKMMKLTSHEEMMCRQKGVIDKMDAVQLSIQLQNLLAGFGYLEKNEIFVFALLKIAHGRTAHI